jgi:hypothetical protein
MLAVTRTRRQWVTKHCSGFCATGTMMKKWGKRTTAKCPRCDLDEDATHVWKCRGSGANEIWMKAMDKFKKELVMAHTLPNLADVICNRLTALQYNTAPTVSVSNFLGLQKTIDDQNKSWMASDVPKRCWKAFRCLVGKKSSSDI